MIQQLLGFVLSLSAGLFDAFNFVPIEYLLDSGRGHSSDAIDYLPSHLIGMFAASFIVFLVYCGALKHDAFVSSTIVIPASCSGMTSLHAHMHPVMGIGLGWE